jgi:hypothetical protein
MRPMALVVINEDAKHMLEMLWVEDQEPIETLRANGAHEPVMSHQWAEPSCASAKTTPEPSSLVTWHAAAPAEADVSDDTTALVPIDTWALQSPALC